MPAAIALAVVLVIAVAGASMAMESQRGQVATRRPTRPSARSSDGPSDPPREPRTRSPLRKERSARSDPTAADGPPPPGPPPPPEPELKLPELRRTGSAANARVISVVDERTIGPVTRSRLALRIEPEGQDSFEVTVRHAFQTPEQRSQVKVGGQVAVRFDPEDHRRVVLDLPTA